MRKFLGVILSAVLVFSLAACGKEVIIDEPAVDDPVVEEPVVDNPVVEEPEIEEPVVSVEPEDPSSSEDPSNENGEVYDFIEQYETIKSYYNNYLSEGFSEGKFVSPETGMIIYSPMYAMLDLNGDNFDDIIVAGELGLRSKQISEIYYFNDGNFCTADIGGVPYGVTTDGFLVQDNDHDTEGMTMYQDEYIYTLGFDEAVEVMAKFTATSYDQEGNEEIVETYRVAGEEADEQEFFMYFTPYIISYDDISYEEFSFENMQ